MPKKMELNYSQIYQFWIDKKLHAHNSPTLYQYKFLKNKDLSQKYIPMPPPNITGKLHMGHALFLAIQDGLTRYWKNQGRDTLWQPGLDHAGLATHEKILIHQKENNLSYEESAQILSEGNKGTILSQIKELGSLPDWNHLRYTLDNDYQEFTISIIKILFEDGRLELKDDQIYLNLDDYAQKLSKDLKSGHFNIEPNYEIKNLLPFIDNLEKWNISRQIPWGTKLPFSIENGSLIFNKDSKSIGSLDTWFNSSLWPIACLSNNPSLLNKYYPATLIETGADILFFWCARMLMMSNYIYDNQKRIGLELKRKYAFDTIYLHGIIKDKFGRKFSKSLGNGIDPLDMIKKYGPDATRLFIISRSGPSEDIIFNEEHLPGYKNFINKIYNSARFFSMYASKIELEKINEKTTLIDINNNTQIQPLQELFSAKMDELNFLEASRLIHSKFKEEFCDRWIEDNKSKIQALDKETITQGILLLDQYLALLEPFCPFICYEIKSIFFDI